MLQHIRQVLIDHSTSKLNTQEAAQQLVRHMETVVQLCSFRLASDTKILENYAQNLLEFKIPMLITVVLESEKEPTWQGEELDKTRLIFLQVFTIFSTGLQVFSINSSDEVVLSRLREQDLAQVIAIHLPENLPEQVVHGGTNAGSDRILTANTEKPSWIWMFLKSIMWGIYAVLSIMFYVIMFHMAAFYVASTSWQIAGVDLLSAILTWLGVLIIAVGIMVLVLKNRPQSIVGTMFWLAPLMLGVGMVTSMLHIEHMVTAAIVYYRTGDPGLVQQSVQYLGQLLLDAAVQGELNRSK